MPPRNHPSRSTRSLTEPAGGRAPDPSAFKAASPWQSVARWLSVFSFASLLVVVVLVPSDSIAVEQGGALPLLPLALLAWVTSMIANREQSSGNAERILDLLVWALAAWIGIAAIAVAGVGNLRGAVNEAWWWVTAAATFTAARRSLVGPHASAASSILLVALACGLAVQAAHQQWVTLPADRAQYEADPEKALQESGIFAPPGSPQRALFESRLYGGGPTATYALTNSLAAMLVIGVILAAGILATLPKGGAGHGKRWRIVIAASFAILLSGVALLWTESRSALLGLAAAGGVAAFVSRFQSRRFRPNRLLGLATAAAVLLALVTGWMLLRPDLLAGAPRSLRYRIEYWRATLDLVADYPWFGAGPGNFQERYVTYRLDQASESIADPHNWLIETLAAGGLPAFLLLVATILVGLKIAAGKGQGGHLDRAGEAPQAEPAQAESVPRGAFSCGAAAGFIGVLVAWLSQAYLPNFDALMLSLLAAVGVAVALRPLAAAPPAAIRRVAGAAAFAIAIHLLAAGGWTVPGVATPWLVLIAIALGVPAARLIASQPDSVQAVWRGLVWRGSPGWFAGGFGGALLVAWLWTAWLPNQRAAAFVGEGDYALQTGRPGIAAEAYQRAAAADPWDPLPLVRQADGFRWTIVRGTDSPEAREHWRTAWEGAIARNPAAAGLRQGRALHRLHFFQRWGNRQDLVDARQDLLDAVIRDHSNVELAAQLAVVEAALANREAAQQWRERAETLAAAGDHTDRQLTIVQVLPAEHVGERAESQPWRVPAAERL